MIHGCRCSERPEFAVARTRNPISKGPDREALLPHVQSALGLRARLSRDDETVSLARAALDALPVSVVIVDDGLKIRFANGRAQRMLGAPGSALYCMRGGTRAGAGAYLVARSRDEAAMLRRLVVSAISGGTGGAAYWRQRRIPGRCVGVADANQPRGRHGGELHLEFDGDGCDPAAPTTRVALDRHAVRPFRSQPGRGRGRARARMRGERGRCGAPAQRVLADSAQPDPGDPRQVGKRKPAGFRAVDGYACGARSERRRRSRVSRGNRRRLRNRCDPETPATPRPLYFVVRGNLRSLRQTRCRTAGSRHRRDHPGNSSEDPPKQESRRRDRPPRWRQRFFRS